MYRLQASTGNFWDYYYRTSNRLGKVSCLPDDGRILDHTATTERNDLLVAHKSRQIASFFFDKLVVKESNGISRLVIVAGY
jgi:hypothetical protein